ncbi:MAG: ImmA/IrrE family metallo-endopeptidase [Firmicutes bacterium]|nr:ImmA/IrrE family metallo-endopeptidase [Bacillota bacterium]
MYLQDPNYIRAIKKSTNLAILDIEGKLPIDPLELIHKHGWQVFTYSEVALESGQSIQQVCKYFHSNESVTFCNYANPDYPLYKIFYNDTLSIKEINMALAHEIGHITLGHFCDPAVTRLNFSLNTIVNPEIAPHLETEANIYAINLLCPAPLFDVYKLGEDDIIAAFNISSETAKYCLKFNRLLAKLIKLEDRREITKKFGFAIREKVFKPKTKRP